MTLAEITGDNLQISTLLKGADARRFREYKDSERLLKDAEAARKLILERLAEVEAERDGVFQRKPNARASATAKAEAREIVRDVLREALENVG